MPLHQKQKFQARAIHSLKDSTCWRSPHRKLDIVAADSLVLQQKRDPNLLQLFPEEQPAPILQRLVPVHVVEQGFQRLKQQHATFDDAETKSKLHSQIADFEARS